MKLSLYGRSEIEAARADELCVFIYECAAAIAPVAERLATTSHQVSGEERQIKSANSKFQRVTPTARLVLPILNRALECTRSGFLLGSGFSYVDILAVAHLAELQRLRASALLAYPRLRALQRRVIARLVGQNDAQRGDNDCKTRIYRSLSREFSDDYN